MRGSETVQVTPSAHVRICALVYKTLLDVHSAAPKASASLIVQKLAILLLHKHTVINHCGCCGIQKIGRAANLGMRPWMQGHIGRERSDS